MRVESRDLPVPVSPTITRGAELSAREGILRLSFTIAGLRPMRSREASVKIRAGLAGWQLPVTWWQERRSLALNGLWTQQVSGLWRIMSDCRRQNGEDRTQNGRCR